MSTKIIRILTTQYDLPNIKSIEKVKLGGYLNESFIISTKEGKFFLQQTNKKLRKNIVAEINVLEFLGEKKFPTVYLVKNRSDKYLTLDGDDYYLLSKFIEGHSPVKFNDLSAAQLVEAAKTLAIYHKIIENYSAPKINNPNTASKDEAIKICSEVKEILGGEKKNIDSFDTQIKEIIDKKLSLLYDLKLPDKLSKCPQLFCHGDYHGANLIFNPEGKIVGIVDWEFFGYDYRIWEVMRSMSFICDIDYTGSMVGPIDMNKAYKYLKTYTELYPLTQDEFDVMIELIKYKSICCCFVIEQHYLKGNKETDVFLPKKKDNWFWWLENKALFKKKVVDKLI